MPRSVWRVFSRSRKVHRCAEWQEGCVHRGFDNQVYSKSLQMPNIEETAQAPTK